MVGDLVRVIIRLLILTYFVLFSFSSIASSGEIGGSVSSPLSIGFVGRDYAVFQLYKQSAGEVFTYTATGFPPGLIVKRVSDGLILSGVPTAVGSYHHNVEIHVTGAGGASGTLYESANIVIKAAPVINLDVSGLPAGKVGLSYGSHRVTASGGTAPYSYTITGLPDGLTASNDTVSGTPIKAGSFPVSVTVRDAEGFTVTKTQTIVIAQTVIRVQDHTLTVMAGTTGNVDLLEGAVGVPINTAAIVGLSNSDAGNAWIEHDGNTIMLRFKTSVTFTGGTRFYYTLSNAESTSAPAVVNIVARPDPSKYPEVIGLVNAQLETTARLTRQQISNYQQRLEQLHNQGECREDSIGFNLDGTNHQPKLRGRKGDSCSELQNQLSIWSNGQVNLGESYDDNDFKTEHTSVGITGGVDYRFSPTFIGGIGFSYSKDVSDIGDKGSQSRGTMLSLSAYGSYPPSKGIFLNGVVGYGRLDFTNARYVTATRGMASGTRNGQQLFDSVSLGYDYRNKGWLWSPYIRAAAVHAKLSDYDETGAGVYNLAYSDQALDIFTTTLGLSGE